MPLSVHSELGSAGLAATVHGPAAGTSPRLQNPGRNLPGVLVVGSFLPGFALERYAGGNVAYRLQMNGARIIATSGRRSQLLRLADILITAWSRRREYEVAHVTVFSGRAFIYAECVTALLSLLKKPCTLGLHGGRLPEFSKKHPLRFRKLLQHGRAVVCPSRYLYERLKPLKPDMHLIPNAIEISKYPMKPAGSPVGRLVWLRAFHQIYNPSMAPQVLARVLRTVPQAELTMIGPDKADGSLQRVKAEIRKLKLEEKVSLTGAVNKSEVPKVLRNGDIFLNTTNVDNTPVSVIEAMACGLPVVSTNVGGIPCLIENGRTGLLVDPGNADHMADAVLRLLAEPGLACRLSENARKLAESFDWKIILPQWERLFSQVAAGVQFTSS